MKTLQSIVALVVLLVFGTTPMVKGQTILTEGANGFHQIVPTTSIDSAKALLLNKKKSQKLYSQILRQCVKMRMKDPNAGIKFSMITRVGFSNEFSYSSDILTIRNACNMLPEGKQKRKFTTLLKEIEDRHTANLSLLSCLENLVAVKKQQ